MWKAIDHLIKKSLLVFKLVWIERMIYRANFYLEILSSILASLIVVFLWLAVYRNSTRALIGGYSIAEMVTYLLGGALISGFIATTAWSAETSQSIRDGSLSNMLSIPISPYMVWFVRDIGNKAFLLFLCSIGYLLVFFCFKSYLVPPVSFKHFLLVLLSIVMGSLLQFSLFQAVGLLAFWVENTAGIRFTMRVLMEVAGGAIIPLSFFPQLLNKLFLLFPFHFLIYLPMRTYLGKLTLDQVLVELAKESLWVVGLVALNLTLWKKGLRQYVSMGD
jgi:ABC-2 type transport system permease protein